MSINNHLRLLSFLASIFYTRFRIGRFRFGWYLLLGITPGVGDIVSVFLGIYSLWVGKKMNVSKKEMNQMIKNIFIDLPIGVFPVIGEIFGTLYKAHIKNIQILKKHQQNIVEGEVV